MTSKWRIDVDVTSRRRIDVDTTSFDVEFPVGCSSHSVIGYCESLTKKENVAFGNKESHKNENRSLGFNETMKKGISITRLHTVTFVLSLILGAPVAL